MCHVPYVTCLIKKTSLLSFIQIGGASRWRVCYEWGLSLFFFFLLSRNFYILPYQSYQCNDMVSKSQQKLCRSQLSPDYATGHYLLTLLSISSKEPISEFCLVHTFFNAKFYITNFSGNLNTNNGRYLAFNICFFFC